MDAFSAELLRSPAMTLRAGDAVDVYREPSALALCRPHLAHEVQVGDRGVVAPYDVELRLARRFRPDAGCAAVGARTKASEWCATLVQMTLSV